MSILRKESQLIIAGDEKVLIPWVNSRKVVTGVALATAIFLCFLLEFIAIFTEASSLGEDTPFYVKTVSCHLSSGYRFCIPMMTTVAICIFVGMLGRHPVRVSPSYAATYTSVSNIILLVIGFVPCVGLILLTWHVNGNGRAIREFMEYGGLAFGFFNPSFHMTSTHICFIGFVIYQLTHGILGVFNLITIKKRQNILVKGLLWCTIYGFICNALVLGFYVAWRSSNVNSYEWLAVAFIWLYFASFPFLVSVKCDCADASNAYDEETPLVHDVCEKRNEWGVYQGMDSALVQYDVDNYITGQEPYNPTIISSRV